MASAGLDRVVGAGLETDVFFFNSFPCKPTDTEYRGTKAAQSNWQPGRNTAEFMEEQVDLLRVHHWGICSRAEPQEYKFQEQ